jgi:hypothetical protein
MTAFADCNKIKNEDLRKLTELVMTVSTCANSGASYNTLETFNYTPEEGNEEITYVVNTFHAISIVVVAGSIIKDNVTIPAGSSYNLEFTALNAQDFTFTVTNGSNVLVELIKEDI